MGKERKKISTEKLVQLFQETTDKKCRDNCFKEVLKRFETMIGRNARFHENNYGMEAKELKQELYITLFTCMNNFEPKGATFKTYFIQACDWNCFHLFKVHKKRKDKTTCLTDEQLENYEKNCENKCDYNDLVIDINLAMDKSALSNTEKDIIIKHGINNIPISSIAKEENCTRQNINKKYVKAVKKIDSFLREVEK